VGADPPIALGSAALTFLFLKGEIMSLEFALKDGPQPDRSYRYPAPCPVHPHGDEARLDYLIKGWPGGCNGTQHKRCVRVWRANILCDAFFQVFYCDKALPDVLRRVTRASGFQAVATLGRVTARGGGVAK